MKTLIKIIIIFILVFLIYTIRDDVSLVLNKYIAGSQQEKKSFNIGIKELPPITKINTDTQNQINTGLVQNIKNLTDKNKKLSIEGVLLYTNKNRIDNKIPNELVLNKKLNNSAAIKLQDMFTNEYFEHVSPKGVSVGDLAQNVNYNYITIGENLALGNFKDDQTLVDAWMASPGHRANILSNKYTEIGIATGYGSYKGQNTWLAVQHFGTPKEICPEIDNILSQTIKIEQEMLNKTATELQKRLEMINSGALYQGLTTNEQIAVYNNMVNSHNKNIADIKAKILNYNAQVKNFNNCLQNHV